MAMLKNIERRMMLDGARRVHHIGPLDLSNLKGLASEVFEQMHEEFIAAPPLTLHVPAPRVFAVAWELFREALLVGKTPRLYREVVAASVSSLNACPYCVEGHTMSLSTLKHNQTANALLNEHVEAIEDQELRRMASWGRATRTPDAPILYHHPFEASDATRLRSVAFNFHYINRMVHLFLDDSPMPLPGPLKWMRGLATRIGGRMSKHLLTLTVKPGLQFEQLPEVKLPEELEWFQADASLASTVARFIAVTDEEARLAVSDDARQCVRKAISRWRGEDPGFGRLWLDRATQNLSSAASKAEARLILQVAMRSHKVDQAAIHAYRNHRPKAADFVRATAWAAQLAARRVGSWMAPQAVSH